MMFNLLGKPAVDYIAVSKILNFPDIFGAIAKWAQTISISRSKIV
jgi:hypothetical protein